MSWGLGWKRPTEVFHLTLSYGQDVETIEEVSPRSSQSSSVFSGSSPSSQEDAAAAALVANSSANPDQLGFKIELDWNASDGDDQVALKLQSQVMVALPTPQDTVEVELTERVQDGDHEVDLENGEGERMGTVGVEMRVVKRREPLKGVIMWKAAGSGQQTDGGMGVLVKLMRLNFANGVADAVAVGSECADHWRNVSVVSLCGLGLSALPVEITRLPLLEKLYLDNNKLSVLPPEVGELKHLKVLAVDYNMLVSVPVELRQCAGLLELSLEQNKLVRPILDFRAMSELRVLRLFGNPLEFLPDILPLNELRHLSLANIRIVADENLVTLDVQIEMENSSYFVASRHKLSAFFSLVFRFSSCHHPLLASALAKIMQDEGNRVVVGKDENAVRQLISMISSENQHVVEQACSALSNLTSDSSVAMQLMKSDIMQPIERVLKSTGSKEVISVLQVMVKLAFTSDIVAQKMLTKDILKSLKLLCAHKNPEVQRLALFAIGNFAFCLENRRALVTSESLHELLLRLTTAPEPGVCKAAARALAILGENEILRRAIRGRQIPKRGLRILTMDGGGMKGLATVKMLKEIEKGTGKQIHELFDLICGTSTGGMLAVALGIKSMSLEKCEEIYKELGKLVFAEPVFKENEAATWREKLDQLYKSSSQSFRVVVHGSKHSADQFEKLLKEMCAEEDGDLLIESAVKKVPKVFVVSTLVSVAPAQPFIFRNYQYPVGTPELSFAVSENLINGGQGVATTGAQVGYKRNAYIGSCKHLVWQAIRASSAAPYYLDDFSDGIYRWQDGAIVANNPTIFAIREAQLLWPDLKIDCLVSIGCGSVPTKVRKGGWRYLDTGQVLIESACSVDRVEEALTTLLPMLPDVQYFRFNPVDERCDMELDETDPAIWLKLEGATEEYIKNNSMAFKNLAERLLESTLDDKFPDSVKSQLRAKVSNDNTACLGWRRGVLLIEASNSPDSGRVFHHARSLETFCANNGIRLSLVNGAFGTIKAASGSAFPTPFISPLFTGSFPSTPLVYSPDTGTQRGGRIDLVPPLSLDGLHSAKSTASSPESPPKRRQLAMPILSLHEKIQNSLQVGVVHLALQNDTQGSILCWQNDVFVVAEPGELAEKFLQNVKYSLLSMMKGRKRKYTSVITNISTVADLVSCRPYFQIGGVVHRYIGRQTQVMEDDQEIGAYMFRRTVPSMHLTPEDVRCMVGSWRDRIIIFTGIHGPTRAMTKAFLDSGAKAVICPSSEPEELQLTSFYGAGEFSSYENGKFEIGYEEGEDEDPEPSSPVSDWEDSEPDKNGEPPTSLWDDDEKELSQFVSRLYESMFQGGARVDVALKRVLASHKSLRYSCHLSSKP
ncbi:phospholipase A I-like isoform X1 [Salvia splendens]|uniref:phospholipase A I-like isoform X1 n=1 Tax=Salvia splendens TaxID=180675 RepID=UPI001C277A52|nr:phospholipase A I-like isoform X1 [Salvia splendens]XP_042021736.1 phospholipase A I-like isoform X1 [Salvia splendens]XP_042021737.1 phospholipase A I-like isoform X1 [Salvia splendens]XP_042021738.1 phospholipase A I-like isoform X1 [Salvia splendens]